MLGVPSPPQLSETSQDHAKKIPQNQPSLGAKISPGPRKVVGKVAITCDPGTSGVKGASTPRGNMLSCIVGGRRPLQRATGQAGPQHFQCIFLLN